MALKYGVLPLTILSDCLNVVDSWNRGATYCTSYVHPNGHIWRKIFDLLDDVAPLITIAYAVMCLLTELSRCGLHHPAVLRLARLYNTLRR